MRFGTTWRTLAACLALCVPVGQAAAGAVDRSATPADWAALAKLPDWSGTWTPNLTDQVRQIKTDPVPWTPAVAQQVAHMQAEEKEGHPCGLFVNCFPEGMSSWMLISHNALEILFSPGQVTLLGESDGNRLRRIYTDGRGHAADPDPSFHGDSIGRWESDTLVVDTVGVLPQSFNAVSEAVGVPNTAICMSSSGCIWQARTRYTTTWKSWRRMF